MINTIYILPIFIFIAFYFETKTFSIKKHSTINYSVIKCTLLNYFWLPSLILFIILLSIGLTVMHFNSITRILGGYPFFFVFLEELYQKAGTFTKKVIRLWIVLFQVLVIVTAVNNYIPM